MTDLLPPAYPAARGECPFGPPKEYGAWRDVDGLGEVTLQGGERAWVATGYDYFRELLGDPRVSSDPENPGMPVVFPSHSARIPTRKSWRNMDDPEHGRMRRMVNRRFNAPSVEKLRPMIEERVVELLDAMSSDKSSADLMEEFAYPLPLIITCDLLGVPYDKHAFFKQKVDQMFAPGGTPEDALAAGQDLSAYMSALIDDKQDTPSDDIMSDLVGGQLAKGELERSDVINTSILLLVGGLEAVASMIGGSVILLTRHPEQLAALRDSDDPTYVANAVEELLRFVSPTENGINRTIVEDFEIGGHQIRTGDGLIVNAPAANRDPRIFTDPEVLDTTKAPDAPHVAFGAGVHQYIGQTLARVELQIALPALLRRLPDLHITVADDEIPYRPNMQLFGVKSLPVAW